MRVLNVAEKPSVAKAISEILSQGHCSKVGGLRGLICGESWADGPPLEPNEAHPDCSLIICSLLIPLLLRPARRPVAVQSDFRVRLHPERRP